MKNKHVNVECGVHASISVSTSDSVVSWLQLSITFQVAMQLQNEATWSTPHCLLVPGLPISQKAVKNVDSGKA